MRRSLEDVEKPHGDGDDRRDVSNHAIMRTHSILGALMNVDAAHDNDSFLRGLDMSRAPRGLLNPLFSIRADGLFGVIDADQQSLYL